MTRPVMYTSIAALAGNIAGDYILMYGKLGLPRLGAAGCGVTGAPGHNAAREVLRDGTLLGRWLGRG